MQRIYSCLRAELVLAAHHEMSERDKENLTTANYHISIMLHSALLLH